MLTRRGRAVAGVAVAGFVMAAWFGARSLNAVVAPAAVALAAGWLQLRRVRRPAVDVRAPEYGFAGETVTVSVDVDAPTPLTGTVSLAADDGLSVGDPTVETAVDDGTIPFETTLDARGVQSLGPVELAAEDVLGVCARTYSLRVDRDVVVFPRIRRLEEVGDLAALRGAFGAGGRDRFTGLREYERGDPLRDVHWAASAKRPDEELLVREYEAEAERQQVELLAEAGRGRMDEVAEAAASVLTYLLDAGLAVGLTVPGGRVDPGTGTDHRTELLTLLARARPGAVAERRREEIDVVVQGRADESAVRVTVGERTVTFDRLSGAGGAVGAADATALADGGASR